MVLQQQQQQQQQQQPAPQLTVTVLPVESIMLLPLQVTCTFLPQRLNLRQTHHHLCNRIKKHVMN